MGLTERHWFEDEEEARRWLEEGKEKKMVVYDAIVKGSHYGAYEDYDPSFTRTLGLYKTRESAVKAIMNINRLFDQELRPLEDDFPLPADCIRGVTNRYFDDDWAYFFYIKEREVLD